MVSEVEYMVDLLESNWDAAVTALKTTGGNGTIADIHGVHPIIMDIRDMGSAKSTDAQGNQYIISAKRGEIDYSVPNILFLTDVSALIKLTNSDNILITSNFGKYNSNNFDTIFSKNVLITYLDNKIKANYLDFSLERNSMIITGKVIYNNLENILEADVIEINIKTKDTKIFMYENGKKVNIRSIN